MEFRPRNYVAEAKSHALPRLRADEHPFSAPSSPSPLQWVSFKRFLTQRFPVSKMVSVSSVSDSLIKGGVKTLEKSSTSKHLEELEDPEKFTEEGTKVITGQIISAKGATKRNINEYKRLFVSLMEPTIQFMLKCIFKDSYQRQVGKVLVELGLGKNEEEMFGTSPYVSIVLHHLLKELPTEVVSSNAVKILNLIECSDDVSFNQ
ncbi:hypothetical protein UlMin_003652, partial [Ulmus minor]